jgi:UDP-N-acetylglucosamine acyltransferase
MIHSTACVDPNASVAEDAEIGAFTVIGPQVTVESGCRIGPHVVIEGHTRIGAGTQVSQFASLGAPPQDKGYAGEDTRTDIGRDCIIREYVTVHRGTPKDRTLTTVGDGCFLMAYSHVAHDCELGTNVVLANAVNLAGHVVLGDYVNVGGLTAIHQFARVGRMAFVGGASAVSLDVPPFSSAAGNRAKLYGLNSVGLKRSGMDKAELHAVRRAYRVLFQQNTSLEEALAELRASEDADVAPVAELIEFVATSERGVVR